MINLFFDNKKNKEKKDMKKNSTEVLSALIKIQKTADKIIIKQIKFKILFFFKNFILIKYKPKKNGNNLEK